MKRHVTGIPALDKKIEGGFPEKTVILLSGNAGTGKTLLGLNFLLEGAKKGEKGCYISVNETEEELLRACEGIKPLRELKKYLGKKIALEYIPLGKVIDLEYFTNIFASYPKVDRLVIDNVNKLLIFAESKQEFRRRLTELVHYLKGRVGVSLLLCETLDHTIDTGNGEAFETDGVINLDFIEVEEKPRRMLTVYKMRYTAFEERVPYELVISKEGFKLKETHLI